VTRRQAMLLGRGYGILLIGVLLFLNSCAKGVVVHPNCPVLPKSVFRLVNTEGKLGSSTIGKVLIGDANLKLDQSIVSTVSQSIHDDYASSVLICKMKEDGDIKDPAQIAHAWTVIRFYRTNPTAEQAMRFHAENPFPAASPAAASRNGAPSVSHPRVTTQPPVTAGPFQGQWHGVLREYYKEIGEIISAETLDLDDGGKAITGSSRHTFMLPRSWDIMGISRRFANKSILILMYMEKDPVQPSLGTIVVEGNPAEGELRGYWQGFDRDRNKLVACPYVLSRTADFGIVKARQTAWLDRPCYLQP